MKNDISLILIEFHRRRQFFTLQAELETRQTDILALDYEIDHAFSPFQSKKKQSLIQKREVLHGQLTSLKEEISHSVPFFAISGRSVGSQDAKRIYFLRSEDR